ncbi:MAG: hypothetical protein ACP5MZ_01020 [Candidatus Micrarchaeia archaeon]
MADETAMLIKLDRHTKERMREIHVNWSNEIRNFIKERISDEKNPTLAVMLADKVFNSQKRKNTDTTSIIRKFRDTRYGAHNR